MKLLVPLIVWMHSDCHVTKHGFDSRRGNDDFLRHALFLVGAVDRVREGDNDAEFDGVFVARHVAVDGMLDVNVLDLDVGDGSAEFAAPVNEAVLAIDQAILNRGPAWYESGLERKCECSEDSWI
jgi:hypothetical protein